MHATTGERALWRAVICNAFDDAAGSVIGVARTVVRGSGERVPNPAHTAAIDQARAWFRGNGDDYREVCSLAEVDPEAVRDLALRHIAAADAGELDGQSPLTTVLANGGARPVPVGEGAEEGIGATAFLDDHAVRFAPDRDEEAA